MLHGLGAIVTSLEQKIKIIDCELGAQKDQLYIHINHFSRLALQHSGIMEYQRLQGWFYYLYKYTYLYSIHTFCLLPSDWQLNSCKLIYGQNLCLKSILPLSNPEQAL